METTNETRAIVAVTVDISVEWYKSRTWGYCPRAEVRLYLKDTDGRSSFELLEGKASGYGYDKLSAAIAQAVNKSEAFCQFLAENYAYAIADQYGIAVRNGKASFSPGVGVECFNRFAKNNGSQEPIHKSGKMYDAIEWKFSAK
jgi:hypothetical protein